VPDSPLLTQITQFINQTGFPIFVAVILLWRVDSMHTANLKAIEALTLAVNELRSTLRKD